MEVSLDERFWDSPFATSVFQLFASVNQAAMSSPPLPPNLSFEIEARTGTKGEDGKFKPGTTEKRFKGMLDYFKPKIISETYDYNFTQTHTRVTVQVDSQNSEQVSVAEVIRKEKPDTFYPIDVLVRSNTTVQDNMLRIALALEYSLPLDGADTLRERELALADAKSRRQPREFVDKYRQVLAGANCTISNLDLLPTTTPHQCEDLLWTMIRRPGGLEEEEYTARTEFLMGNLPTGMRPSGADPVSLFEYQVSVPLEELRIVQSSSAIISSQSKRSKLSQELPHFFRHKKRWKMVNEFFILDLTQTMQTGEEGITYEIEFERCVNRPMPNCPQAVKQFLAAIWNIHFTCNPKKLGFDIDERKLVELMSRRANAQPRVIPFRRITTTTEKADDEKKTAGFYGDLKRDLGSRHQSYIFHMRCFNNFVKSMLIKMYLPQQPRNAYTVLELACGKGADLNKLKQAIPPHAELDYVGTDIAKQSLEQGIERLASGAGGRGPEKHMYRFVAADLSQCDLTQTAWSTSHAALDMYDSRHKQWRSTVEIMPPLACDMATMQFAFHYMCKTTACLDQFLGGVAAWLKEDAHFIVTTVDSDALMEELACSPFNDKIEIRDDISKDSPLLCQVQFTPEAVAHLQQDAGEQEEGIKYQFKLFDGHSEEERAVDAPEYLVILPLLERLAEKHGLEIVKRERLGRFAHECLENNVEAQRLWERMEVPNWQGTMSRVEWRIANLYQVLVFKKLNGLTKAMHACSRVVPGWDKLNSGQRLVCAVELLNEKH